MKNELSSELVATCFLKFMGDDDFSIKKVKPPTPYQLELSFPIVLDPVLTKKGMKKLGGSDKLKITDVIIQGINEGHPY